MDMAKYRVIFIEESVEHLGEMSSAMLELEKGFVAVRAAFGAAPQDVFDQLSHDPALREVRFFLERLRTSARCTA